MDDLISVTKQIFFDRQKVIDAMDRKERRVLSSTGAFARTVMRQGMRRRKRISTPGEFPSAHNGTLRDRVYFGFTGKAVIIGPELFKRDPTVIGGETKETKRINEGGVVTRRRHNKPVRQVYRPRPFVALTAPKAAAKLAENMEKFEFK